MEGGLFCGPVVILRLVQIHHAGTIHVLLHEGVCGDCLKRKTCVAVEQSVVIRSKHTTGILRGRDEISIETVLIIRVH